MFGLENQKKPNTKAPFIFELEKTLSNARTRQQVKEKVERRLQEIKTGLRAGDDKEKFDQLGVLLQGYKALERVMGRVTVKS